ncbi:MAG: hypothetical protein ACOCP8_00285 [archaeon]
MEFKNVKIHLNRNSAKSRIEVDGEPLKYIQKVEVIQDINSKSIIPQLKLTITPENIEIEGEMDVEAKVMNIEELNLNEEE